MNNFSSKKIIALIAALTLTLSLVGCTQPKAASQSTADTTQSSASKMLDREGNEFTVPATIHSIISMAPSITETLIHLGLGDKIIAIDQYSQGMDGLPENLPMFDMMAPDTERIASLHPDIIFATGMSKVSGENPFQALLDLGIVMTYIPSSTSIAAIQEDLLFLGQATGTSKKAKEIVQEMNDDIAEITAKIGTQKSNQQIFFEIAAAPDLYSFGKNTFLNEIIELLGCTNILAEQDSWVSVSEEAVLSANPDIIFTTVNYIDHPVSEILNRNGWNAVNAVKNAQVYQLDVDNTSRPNEFIVEAIEDMAEILYPALFK